MKTYEPKAYETTSGTKYKVQYRYYDENGVSRNSTKNSFDTYREAAMFSMEMALEYEEKKKAVKENRELIKEKEKKIDEIDGKNDKLSLTLKDFYECVYLSDLRSDYKLNTLLTKKNIYYTKIDPYLGTKVINDIKTTDLLRWRAEILALNNQSGKKLSPSYVKQIRNQLSAIFNHAVAYYNLEKNPLVGCKTMGCKKGKEKPFWSLAEYNKFSYEIMENEEAFVFFELLYWGGFRRGEALALTPSDFNFKKQEVKIEKSMQVIKGEPIVTSPKTEYSYRTVKLPQRVMDEVENYINTQYAMKKHDRIFNLSISSIRNILKTGAENAGLECISPHCLRHSHVSLLANQGYSIKAIAKRVGHSADTITLQYSHMFPSEAEKIIEELEELRNNNNF